MELNCISKAYENKMSYNQVAIESAMNVSAQVIFHI